jgi:hypothetical protein
MPKIVFQGKEYDSIADMPAKVRHDYFKFKAGYDIPEEAPEKNVSEIPGGMDGMPKEVREIYERVRGELDAKPTSTKTSPVDSLPKTEDLYRRSAPDGMRDRPSDEIVYKPSPPIIEPPPPIVESDHTLRRLALAVGVALLLLGIAAAFLFGA